MTQQDKKILEFSAIKMKILDEMLAQKDCNVPYDIIKMIIMTSFVSPRWSKNTYQIKHNIEGAYTIAMDNGKHYYCANNWVKCAIWDLNMYEHILTPYGEYNYYDIVDDNENKIITPETILDNSVNWHIKVHTAGRHQKCCKYIR